MKDIFEHERKMCKLIQQMQSPMQNAIKAFENTSIYRAMNYQSGIINVINQSPISKSISSLNTIKTYCLPNSLMGASSTLTTLSNSLAMLATGPRMMNAAQSAMSNFINQQQRLVSV